MLQTFVRTERFYAIYLQLIIIDWIVIRVWLSSRLAINGHCCGRLVNGSK